MDQERYKVKWYFCFIFVIFATNWVRASETRVDSAGSLSLVISDETAEIDPYMFDNPAGLVVLPHVNRLDVNFPWFSTSSQNRNNFWGSIGISPGQVTDFPNLGNSISGLNPASSVSPYQGIIFFPGNQWAVQLGSGFFDLSGSPYGFFGIDDLGSNEQIKCSGSFGFLSIGAEIQWSQINSTTKSRIPPDNTASQSSNYINFGLLENIPIGSKDQSAWIRVGESFFFNGSPDIFTLNTNIAPFSSNPLIETDIIQTSNYIWTPSVFLDVSGTFQAGVIGDFNYGIQNLSSNFSNPILPNVPKYKSQATTGINFAALYKWKMALDSSGKLTFNHGILFTMTFNNPAWYDPTGVSYLTSKNTSSQVQCGFGLESEKDFMVGLQLNNSASTGYGTLFPSLYNFSKTNISLGAEKWFFSQLALRIGLAYVDNKDYEGFENPSLYWLQPGQDLSGVMLTTGIGYENKLLKVDGMFWFEQPTSSGAYSSGFSYTGPDFSYTLLGLQLEAAIFF